MVSASSNALNMPAGQFLSLQDAALAELAERNLYDFTRQAWDLVVSRPLIDNWHIQAICEHLEAVSRREIRRLIINIPPRCSKSTLVSVMWPAWTWISSPEIQFLAGTYAKDLALRDCVASRNLINTNWYQQRWGDRFSFQPDQNAKGRYDNNKLGRRVATSVDGMGTGEGGDIILCDDPHKVKEAQSAAKRQAAIDWWNLEMSTRGNDSKTVCFVLIMQRVHEDDLTGNCLEAGGWEHLCLPMRYEEERKCVTSLGIPDPRTEEGELLCEERFPDDELKSIEDRLGDYGTAGQMQQRPAPIGGGVFDPSSFGDPKSTYPSNVIRAVRYWDCAGSEAEGDYTVGVLGIEVEEGFFIVDVTRGQWSYHERIKQIKAAVQDDVHRLRGREKYTLCFEQEPGSSGKDVAGMMVRMFAGFNVKAIPSTGDKEVRAIPYARQVREGNVTLIKASWNRKYLEELKVFPYGTNDDQVDASSGMFNEMTSGEPDELIVA